MSSIEELVVPCELGGVKESYEGVKECNVCLGWVCSVPSPVMIKMFCRTDSLWLNVDKHNPYLSTPEALSSVVFKPMFLPLMIKMFCRTDSLWLMLTNTILIYLPLRHCRLLFS